MPAKDHISLRIPSDLLEWIDREAKADKRNRTNFILKVLTDRKDQAQKKTDKP